jgi:8-oxo-dGTP pyrophosphatase MutT (NUDIX family)
MQDFEDSLTAALASLEPHRATVEGAREAAVLIPIVAEPAPTLILTQRTDTVGSHKGQISFPGGAVDPNDASTLEAALRETQEEIGLDPERVRVIGELDTFPTFVSGFVVTPYIGWLDATPRLQPNPGEVAALLHVPIAELNEGIRFDPGFSHRDRTYPTEAWVWNDRVIWGVTARILRQFLTVVGSTGLIEAPGGDPSFWHFPPGHLTP